jgi:hypothetical protein
MAIVVGEDGIVVLMAVAKVAGREPAAMAISGVPGMIRNADGHRDGATAPAR